VQGLEELIIDDSLFFINGVKKYIKDYENNKRDKYLKESIHIMKVYDAKRQTIRFINLKRKEYKEKVLSVENNIDILSKTLSELELEKNVRAEKIKENNEIDAYSKEKLEDIIYAIEENKRMINYKKNKLNKLRQDFKNFNDTSLEEENKVFIFFNYIKREFIKARKNLVDAINFRSLKEIQLILTYEYLLVITKNMICIEEDLFGG